MNPRSRNISCLVLLLCSSAGAVGCADVVVLGRKVHEASPVTTPASEAAATPAVSVAKQALRDITLVIPTETDPALDPEALATLLRQTLRSRGLLAGGAAPLATVTVRAFETHATSNAVVLGYLPGAGTLSAEVRVTDGSGTELSRFDASAAAVLRAPASNPRVFPLAPLYRDLAERIANRLTGNPSP